MKGILMSQNGKLYKFTTPAAKDVLKQIMKGAPAVLDDAKEIGPVIELDKLDKDSATAAFLKIEME